MQAAKTIDILLVEDNEGDVEMLKAAIDISGLDCRVGCTYDGEEGLAYLRKERNFQEAPDPDIIFLDLNMPRMGGKELLDIIKQDEKLRTTPVIVLTSSQSPQEIEECYQKYANAYIVKPMEFDELLHVAEAIKYFWVDLAAFPAQ